MIINLLYLTIIIVIIIDISGIIDSIKNIIKKWLHIKGNISIKPFDCSLCMTHWICLIYLLLIGQLTIINYLIICILMISTTLINDLILSINGLISKLIKKLD